ncbi:hypothetical protein GPECTOR_7g1316 [Gonium pectorale]|uniref:Uncharacterized protein n=1 Tax=Gonium pectorale TaxID=33097 RepID=A0A150GUP8_GONPE|nr:hypothetical protein GPECTOR_7g1316 [Gonium pectorale]|eukprot:KXZ53418.1 hypothetical protein GPECTOR_7g1316 [Gonium pectorale]
MKRRASSSSALGGLNGAPSANTEAEAIRKAGAAAGPDAVVRQVPHSEADAAGAALQVSTRSSAGLPTAEDDAAPDRTTQEVVEGALMRPSDPEQPGVACASPRQSGSQRTLEVRAEAQAGADDTPPPQRTTRTGASAAASVAGCTPLSGPGSSGAEAPTVRPPSSPAVPALLQQLAGHSVPEAFAARAPSARAATATADAATSRVGTTEMVGITAAAAADAREGLLMLQVINALVQQAEELCAALTAQRAQQLQIAASLECLLATPRGLLLRWRLAEAMRHTEPHNGSTGHGLSVLSTGFLHEQAVGAANHSPDRPLSGSRLRGCQTEGAGQQPVEAWATRPQTPRNRGWGARRRVAAKHQARLASGTGMEAAAMAPDQSQQAVYSGGDVRPSQPPPGSGRQQQRPRN